MGSSKKPVTLACENDNLPSHRCSCYANIVAPAYLNIPAVQFQKTDVSWAWSAKVPKQSVRQMMFTNWGAQQWQFTSYLDSSGCFGVQLRRNVPTDGYTNTLQYLVSATSSQCNLWNTWNDYDVTWSRKLSKLNIYINGVLKGSSTVSASMTSSYTSDMFIGNTETHQFGAKLDTVGNADSMFTGGVRDFRIYNTSEPQFQDRCKNSFGYWKKF
ncbi:hypothetical protein BDR26DRAFT_853333 [Obelidium mucronatum]|nr:hypothetical protein BDR26DRAFT_853333 [Obelidium mucronatum]